jgi:hypothetical protein
MGFQGRGGADRNEKSHLRDLVSRFQPILKKRFTGFCSSGLGIRRSLRGVKITIKCTRGRFEDQSAVRARGQVVLDLGLDGRRELPL